MSNQLTSFELKVSEQVKTLGRELTEDELQEVWDELTQQEVTEIVNKKFAEFMISLGENNE